MIFDWLSYNPDNADGMGELRAVGWRPSGGLAAPLRCRRVMHALESPFKVFLDLRKSPVPGRNPRNKHIIVARLGKRGGKKPHGGLETASDTVAVDGAPELFRDREPEPRLLKPLIRGARARFKHKRGRRKPRAPSNSQKFRSFLERLDRHGLASVRETGSPVATALGRQTLAALGPAARDDFDAADRTHAGAEAVTALADKLARLIGPFHGSYSSRIRKRNSPAEAKTRQPGLK